MGKVKAKETRHAGGAPRRWPSTKLGRIIERLADARGMHLDEVAHKAGISFQALNDIRRGKTKNPSSRTLAKIAEALAAPVDSLTAAL